MQSAVPESNDKKGRLGLTGFYFRFARIIQKVGFPKVRVSNYKVVNVLGNCRLPFAIDIMQFSSVSVTPSDYRVGHYQTFLFRVTLFEQ